MLVSRTHRKFCPTAADLLSIMAFLQPQPDHHTQIISQQFRKSPIPDNVLAPPETLRISSQRAHMLSRMTYLALSTGFNGLCSPLLESSIFFPQKQHGQVYQSNNLITNSGSSFILCCCDRTAGKSPGGNGLFGLQFQATVITEGNLTQELSRWLQHIHHHRRGGAACLLPA